MVWQRLMFWRKRQRRDIFTFWDGQRKRSVDPMPTWFAMSEDPECHPFKDCPLADAGDRAAWCRLNAMIRRMFDLKPFDEGGLSEYDLSILFADFMAYVTTQKKKHDDYRTQWELLVGESQAESTTPPDSASCSTPNESSSDEQSTTSPPSPQPPGT